MSKRKRRRAAIAVRRKPVAVLDAQDLSLLCWLARRLRQLADLIEALTLAARQRRGRR